MGSKGKRIRILEKSEQGGLCHRCEHRALFLETNQKHRPRCECGDIGTSKYSCYMYKPVIPVVVKANEGDGRVPFGPWIVSARVHRVGLPEGTFRLMAGIDNSILVWYAPMEKEPDVTPSPRKKGTTGEGVGKNPRKKTRRITKK